MREFTRSIHCRSHAHCIVCRDLEGGRSWRWAMTERFDVPGRDIAFDCPDGLPWNVKETDVPDDMRPAEKKPCGCGKKQQPVNEAVAAPGEVAIAHDSTAMNNVPPPTRLSCLECVEKHLGTAWVLITEHRNGYPHRLLAIGHLHEAEDESQEWPELHAAIRTARKAYQQTEQVPEFGRLAVLMRGVASPHLVAERQRVP